MTTSCEVCGWAAAFGSMLAFGSFGVPIKSQRAVSVDIDPLVFQSYKTIMCFLTCWLVLLFGVEFTFTPWGIVSGLFWVPGGVATVYAIKVAGLAIGIGVGSCFIVLVSFIWGIFIFDEQVHSRFWASFAILSMMTGLFGMAYYSSPESDHHPATVPYEQVAAREEEEEHAEASISRDTDTYTDTDTDTLKSKVATEQTSLSGFSIDEEHEPEIDDTSQHDDPLPAPRRLPEESLAVVAAHDEATQRRTTTTTTYIKFFHGRIRIAERNLGILLAMLFTGIWGGSILVPMKWCNSKSTGASYVISFGIGAGLVTALLWLARFLYNACYYKSMQKAYNSLPSFHLSVMWLPGGISGCLWSIGNFFSMISVFYLGEGVGYPLAQTSILVSGLWGIFYFKEITGKRRISLWLCSASLAIFGILLLSYEHVN